ncbi:hypothetical protein JHK82_052718 [Glycine max]|nr:hypothetical protein JHK82_052718 [Glycine max]
MQFTTPFHNNWDTIVVPSFYHQQWAPEYPDFVHFSYDGTSYQIRLRQHRQKTCRRPRMISREHQTCRRPRMISREHIWTIEITQSMLAAPQPLRLPNCVITHVNACGQHMTILRKFGPPLQWNVVLLDIGIGHRYVIQPWYQFLADSDFSHDDEVSFYYRHDKI